MNRFANDIKNTLEGVIDEMNSHSYLFSQNPKKDFIRKRKLDFKRMINILLSMGSKSLKIELLDNFSYDVETPSASAFVQQRHKLLPEALQYLFHQFTQRTMPSKLDNGYRLLAVDGSDINIYHNPNDDKTYFLNGPNSKGYNLLQLNALYDLCNKVFIDAEVRLGRDSNERGALIDMLNRIDDNEKTIIIADRGYESYNVSEYISQKGWNYLIRIKDINSNGISSGLNIQNQDCFDKDFSLSATRRQTNEIKSNPRKYKFMPQNQVFDFLPVGSKETYPLNFRLVRFPISEDTYEVLMTNLDRDMFPVEKLKELYHMRWGIETSFRELKYALSLTSLHSKKVAFIIQEIFARLTMYNFCEIITLHTVIKHKSGTKHTYQVNYTIAIAICLRFFKHRGQAPPDVEALIAKHILPVRPWRKDPRKVKTKSTVSFIYRVA